MKKAILSISIMLATQLIFCQQNDSLKLAKDTVVKTPPKTEAAAPAKSKRDTRPLKERIALGCGFSFWINPSQTYIELAPVLAYRFPKRLITGVGYRYIYRHDRDYDINLNAWGPNIFARVGLTKRFYLWTEYEILTSEYLVPTTGQEFNKESTSIDSWFIGLGYVRSMGKKGRGGISMQILYNILYYEYDNNPYYSPVTYRIGYYF
jgi:hypothetical protein